MRKILSLFLVAFAILMMSFQFPYKRLNKLYDSDKSKCLVSAKRMMKYFSGNPAPYYFASVVHFEQAQEQETPRRKYNEVTKALNFARKMEMLKDDEFESKVDWDLKAEEINDFTLDLMVELKESKLKKLRDQLKSKLKRLKWNYKEKKIKDEEQDVLFVESAPSSPAPTAVPETEMVDGQFYGVATGTEMVPSSDLASEKEMLRLINAERKRKGMEALVWEEGLAKAARYHAYDMGSQKYFDHDTKDRNGEELIEMGGTFDRIHKFYTESFVNTENIAAGNKSAADAYNQWFYSPGHYDNMFNAASRKVGIGVVYVPNSPFGYYWVFCSAM